LVSVSHSDFTLLLSPERKAQNAATLCRNRNAPRSGDTFSGMRLLDAFLTTDLMAGNRFVDSADINRNDAQEYG
jgi:hypothetical protein